MKYAPGTPVKVTIREQEVLAYAFYGTAEPRLRWYVPNPPWPIKTHDPEQDFDTWFLGTQGTNARPLLVIDPEDVEQVTRLMVLYAGSPLTENEVPEMRQALRVLATPTPPEPSGDRPIVLDKEGDVWQKRNSGWMNTYGGFVARWAELNDRYGPVAVLSEGYTPEAES